MKHPCMYKDGCKNSGIVYIYIYHKEVGSTIAYWLCKKHGVKIIKSVVDMLGPKQTIEEMRT